MATQERKRRVAAQTGMYLAVVLGIAVVVNVLASGAYGSYLSGIGNCPAPSNTTSVVSTLCNPKGLIYNENGVLLIANWGGNDVLSWDGSSLAIFGAAQGNGTGRGGLQQPVDMALVSTPAPEPGTLPALALGAGLLAAWARKRRQ